jgi:hypothetical protein
MEQKELNLNITTDNNEIIIRQGKTIDPKEPVNINISGTLSAPAKFIDTKKDQFDPKTCNLQVDKKKLTITFYGNERSFDRTIVSGSLKPAKILEVFNINGEKKFTNRDMAKILRRHPFLFEDKIKDQYNKLIAALLNFTAKIETTIQDNQDQRGNLKMLLEKQVSQYLPESIKFHAPIFEGEECLDFTVYICCEATSSTVEFYLDSPELYQLEESEAKRLLGEQSKVFADWGCSVIEL